MAEPVLPGRVRLFWAGAVNLIAFCAGAVVCSFPFVMLGGMGTGHPDRTTKVVLDLVFPSAIVGGIVAWALVRKPIALSVLGLPPDQKSPSLFGCTALALLVALAAAMVTAKAYPRLKSASMVATVTNTRGPARERMFEMLKMAYSPDRDKHVAVFTKLVASPSEVPAVRLAALDHLRKSESAPLLRSLARDPSYEVRAGVTSHLDWTVDRQLFDELANDPSIEVQRSVARYVWFHNVPLDPGLTRMLEGFLGSTDQSVVANAAWMLRHERKRQAFEAVLPFVTEWDPRSGPVHVLCGIDRNRANQEIEERARSFTTVGRTKPSSCPAS